MSLRHQLTHKLEPLLALNPDTARMLRGELLALATETGPDGFAEAAEFAEKLVTAYESSPWKRAESAAVRDYFAQLERGMRLLDPPPAIPHAAPPSKTQPTADEKSTVSLVPARFFSGLEWCRLHARAGISDRVLSAVDAARNRNRWVDTVLETMFLVLYKLDAERAMAWMLGFLKARRGRLDADVVRDMLTVWECYGELPGEAVEWLLEWSADEMLARQWPVVVEHVDILLRRRALQRWSRDDSARHTSIAYLRKRVLEGRLNEEALARWFNSGLAEIEERVQFFTVAAENLPDGKTDGAQGDWRQAALFREAQALGTYFVPVLLLADIPLRMANGANQFALAFFGLGKTGETAWRRRLDGLAEKAIRRLFLMGLRSGEKPTATIQKLCFGDAGLYAKLQKELDFSSCEFDSMAQRDRVARRLATHYVNLREHNLLAMEIQRRYRCLMRVLHPDSLGRLLNQEQLAVLQDLGVFAEMMAVAAAARRFIERRRDLNQTVEDRVAADIDFTCELRKRRHRHLRPLVVG